MNLELKLILQFSLRKTALNSLTKLISILGSTDSGSNNVRLKPFSASIFKFFIWIIATTTKIYTKDYFKLNHFNSFL